MSEVSGAYFQEGLFICLFVHLFFFFWWGGERLLSECYGLLLLADNKARHHW